MQNCIKRTLWVMCLFVLVLTVIFVLPTRADAATVDELIYEIVDGEVTIIDCDEFASGELVIPDTIEGYPVTNIGNYSFSHCSSLTSVTIPDSVTWIGNDAFNKCSSLTSVTIPDSVSSISEFVFAGCSSLVSVTIPASVTYIGGNAFAGCSSLVSVTIPASVTFIDYGAFSNCSKLTGIWVEQDNPSYCSDGFGVLFDKTLTSLIQAPGVLSGSYEIPNTVSGICHYAFSHCSGLTSVAIPDSVIAIDNYAFYGCSDLSSVSVGDGVTNICFGTFWHCNRLTSIVIPASVTQVWPHAFYGCTALTDVYYTGTQQQWDSLSVGTDNDPLLLANVHFNYNPSVNTCEHAYGKWVITSFPTFTLEGQQEKTCTDCGYVVTETVPIAVGKVEKWNITLGDALQVNLHLNISQSIEPTAKVKVTVGDTTVTHKAAELEKTEEGLYIVSVELAAAQMADDIIVMVMNKNAIGGYSNYTVRQYADTVLADETYRQYHSLIREMLNYGGAAQNYFEHGTDSFANEGITGVGAAEIPESSEKNLLVAGKVDSANFYAASLVYRNKIAIRFYFDISGSITDYTFAADGKSYTPVLKDGYYYIEVAGILPENLDQQVPLTVTNKDGSTLNVSYSPMNYIVRMNNTGSANLKVLLKALYNYHLAAKTFCCEHIWKQATCTESKTCILCGTTEGELLSHDYQAGLCMVCGYRQLGVGQWSAIVLNDENSLKVNLDFDCSGASKSQLLDIETVSPEWLEAINPEQITYQGTTYACWYHEGCICYYEFTDNTVNVNMGTSEKVDSWPDKIVLKRISATQLMVTEATGEGQEYFGLQPGCVFEYQPTSEYV